jgi:HPt (histidine-containing phosphotransfer) domain-containing protein
MDDFLTQPFKKKDLEPLLVKWMNASSARTPAAAAPAGDAEAGRPRAPSSAPEAPRAGGAAAVAEAPAAAPAGEPEPDLKAIFDWDEAVETFMGEKDVVLDLIGTWRAKADESIVEIETATAAGDFAMLRRAAHALKGSSLNLAIKRLGHAAAELQDAATKQDAAAAARLAAAVKTSYAQLIAALPRILPARTARSA